MKYSLLALAFFVGINAAAIEPRDKLNRNLAREVAVQVAGIDKALSRELPEELKALPVFGEIIWKVKELPFIPKGPHGGVSGAGMVVVDGKIYFAGGFIPEGDGTKDTAYRTSRWAHSYDPATDQWTQLPDLPARREYTRAIATKDAVYVLGGAIQSRPTLPSAEVYRLDVTKTPLAWQTVKPLQVPRTHQSVGKVGDWLIVAGGNNYDVAENGYSEITVQRSTEVLDLKNPDAGWVKRAPIRGAPRGWSATSVVGDKFYMLGGVTFHGSGKEARAPRTRLQETLSYDLAKDEWKRLADFPYQISGWEGESYADRYIITIGGAGARWNDLPFIYDTKEDRWLRSPSALPPGAMFNDPGVCIIGDTIYVAGGEGSGGSHFNHFLIGKVKPRPAAGNAAVAGLDTVRPLPIGSRRELLVDDWLIQRLTGRAEQRLHHPQAREIVLVHDAPWEGSGSGYHSVFRDGNLYRMYYKAWQLTVTPEKVDTAEHPLFCCYAESDDGIHWRKPELGLHEFRGSKANNIVIPHGPMGAVNPDGGHPAVFLDENPAAASDARYKALVRSNSPKGLLALKSADGLRWSPMSDVPVITAGAFDSQNLAFWDAEHEMYRAYWRIFTAGVADEKNRKPGGYRAIRTATSKDFLHWENQADLTYTDPVAEHLYTNQVKPYQRAPHLLIGFPTRYVERPWLESMRELPEREHREWRSRATLRYGTAITEGLFMSSRDGIHFKRWGEAFLPPGPEREGTWNYGQQYIAWHPVETKSALPGAPNELSFYATESYWTGSSSALRRYTLRLDGFVSVHAPMNGGELITKIFSFTGSRLSVNFASSAAGGIQVEIQDASGNPLPGFALADAEPQFGDSVDRTVRWKNGADVGSLAGRPVRLRVALRDADLYSLRFTESQVTPKP